MSFIGVVVGSVDPEVSRSMWEALGYSQQPIPDVPGAVLCLAHPKAPSVLVVVRPASSPAPHGWERGARALDVYVDVLEPAMAEMEALGAVCSHIGVVDTPMMVMRQAMVACPDGSTVVLVESNRRRSSVLDGGGSGVSEPHSVVWVVEDILDEGAFWEGIGFVHSSPMTFSNASIGSEMGLAQPFEPLTMSMVSTEAVTPIRLELMNFAPDGARAPNVHLGAHQLLWSPGDPEWSARVAERGATVDGSAFCSPGGVSVAVVGS